MRHHHYDDDDDYVVVKESSGVGRFFGGLARGAGVALLFAHQVKRGARRARQAEGDAVENVTDKVADTFETERQKVAERIDAVRDKVNEKRDHVARAVRAG